MESIIILFSFIIIIIIIIILYKNKPKTYALLLTTYNEPTRTKKYIKVIDWWLTNSDYDIYVIDSYGKGFPNIQNKRVHIHSFTQSHHFKKQYNIGHYELFAIWLSILHWDKQFQKYDYIVKLTGKYRLPDLSTRLKQINNRYDMLLQNESIPKDKWQNTECIGFHTHSIRSIIQHLYFHYDPTLHFEQRLWKLLHNTQNKYNVFKFQKIDIPIQYRVARNEGNILSAL
jgi:hypothetical protein